MQRSEVSLEEISDLADFGIENVVQHFMLAYLTKRADYTPFFQKNRDNPPFQTFSLSSADAVGSRRANVHVDQAFNR
ncbi:hypothetical protein ACFQ4A_12755 [Lentibacillus salinarum]|uniref:Uncharacterized protein n=1 Tax=Lentibacillus salinarum TaxID=446820 RepID=A0ABW3ZVW2_9BACI